MLAFSDWRINSSDGRWRENIVHIGVISSPEKNIKKWVACVFIEPSARKLRENACRYRSMIVKRTLDVDYIHLGKIGIFSAKAVIFSLCYLINAINNTGTHTICFIFLADSPAKKFIAFVLFSFALYNEIKSDFKWKSYVRQIFFIIIYLIIYPSTKSSGQQKADLLPDHWTFSTFIPNPIQSPSPFIWTCYISWS